MKTKFLSIFALVAILLVNSCKGPEGPIGPGGPTGTAGANGTNGTIGSTGTAGANGSNGKDGGTGATGATGSTGAAGANGKDGNANVVYSEWKTIKTDKVTSQNKDAKGNYTFLWLEGVDKKEPLFTATAINTAAIYSYVKFNARDFNVETQITELKERISLLSQNSTSHEFLLDGKNKDNYNSYTNVYTVNPSMGENYFTVGLIYNFQVFDQVTNKNIPNPDLLGKSLTYFQDVAKNFQIRHVVVYGSTKGRLASVNMKDYNEVKKAFNLKD